MVSLHLLTCACANIVENETHIPSTIINHYLSIRFSEIERLRVLE